MDIASLLGRHSVAQSPQEGGYVQ
ncbi:hypothetical protein CCACVL1_13757 [Corchorus capsularis]|uniref:Uncharacterized protein n=1 Tax=Corchorus capsularis TaxID=210143 RepID=A0A1R3I9Y4_COCAP|nr:hypothetical protein CCACVL1_13757 [Corchorus capsularis]